MKEDFLPEERGRQKGIWLNYFSGHGNIKNSDISLVEDYLRHILYLNIQLNEL